ncbi:MAG: response regulator [Verrucomicrobiota bacterium]|jgi:CheY-like chemotaxis protein
MAKETYTVLLADDSEDDRLLLRRALRKKPRFALVGEVYDGEAVIAWLAGQGDYKDREKFPFPDVLMLDLKMPRMTGHEVLAWLQTRTFSNLRVVVVSGSFLPRDIARSRELGADAYFKKEAQEEQQYAMLSDIEELLDHAC